MVINTTSLYRIACAYALEVEGESERTRDLETAPKQELGMERHEAGTSTSSSASGATAASGFNSSQARQQQTSSTRDAGTASTPTEEHQWWSGVDGRIPGVSPPLGML